MAFHSAPSPNAISSQRSRAAPRIIAIGPGLLAAGPEDEEREDREKDQKFQGLSSEISRLCAAHDPARRRDREDAQRAAAPAHDLERRRDHDRAHRRQLIQVGQARETELPAPCIVA